MRRLFPRALLGAAAFGTDAGAAVRLYRPAGPSQVVLQLGSAAGESRLTQSLTASAAFLVVRQCRCGSLFASASGTAPQP